MTKDSIPGGSTSAPRRNKAICPGAARRGSSTRPRRGNTRSAWLCRWRGAWRCSPGPRRRAPGSSRTITSEFQQPARMLPSLQGLDRAGRVIYLGTFSKLVFPALRLGYAVLPEDLVRPFTAARHLADRQSSSLLQAIGGHFARHLKLMRAIYAERQAFLIA